MPRVIDAPAETTGSVGREERGDALSLQEFVDVLAAELHVSSDGITGATRFREDLELDALQMLKLALFLDALAIPLNVEELSRVRRMGDAYRRYVERRASRRYGEFVCERADEVALPKERARISSPLVSRRTRQRVLGRDDYAYVRSLVLSDESAPPWRRGPSASNPDSFPDQLWHSVLAQHLVLEAVAGAPIGLVTAYDADFRNGTGRVALLLDRSVLGEGWPLESAVLFVNHVFRTWPFRKLYAEVPAHALEQCASGIGGMVREEGRLIAHEYVGAEWSDVVILSLFREAWEAEAPAILRKVVGTRTFVA